MVIPFLRNNNQGILLDSIEYTLAPRESPLSDGRAPPHRFHRVYQRSKGNPKVIPVRAVLSSLLDREVLQGRPCFDLLDFLGHDFK